MLLFMIKSSASMTWSGTAWISSRAAAVGMWVYMPTVSQVNRRAVDGRGDRICKSRRCCRYASELWM